MNRTCSVSGRFLMGEWLYAPNMKFTLDVDGSWFLNYNFKLFANILLWNNFYIIKINKLNALALSFSMMPSVTMHWPGLNGTLHIFMHMLRIFMWWPRANATILVFALTWCHRSRRATFWATERACSSMPLRPWPRSELALRRAGVSINTCCPFIDCSLPRAFTEAGGVGHAIFCLYLENLACFIDCATQVLESFTLKRTLSFTQYNV